MSKALDLNKPPAGATHWDADPSRTASFMMRTGEQWYFWPPTSNMPEWCRWNRGGDLSTFHLRRLPEPPRANWNGPEDGLPPVGLEVWVSYNDCEQGKGRVMFYGKERCLVENTTPGKEREQCGPIEFYTFRPIRTAEQLAAEAHRAKYMPQLIKLWDADTQRTEFLEAVYALIAEALLP